MKDIAEQLATRIATFFSSHIFFWAVILFFVLQALWYVFSAAYPMAFDEDFHFGIIKIYAEQWSPFLQGQPAGADAYGAVARDPSYLFHYLMSFPYRLVELFTQDEAALVIMLRIINLAFFVSGLLLFRKLLTSHLLVSRALSNIIIAIFTLIPIAPHLAATINYDNLFFLLLPMLFFIVQRMLSGFNNRQIDLVGFAMFVVLCFVLALIKYASLPILAGLAFFMLVRYFYVFRGDATKTRQALRRSAKAVPRKLVIALGITLIVTSGLFFQRYGLNLIEYGAVVPDCGKVLSTERCLEYGPWARNYYLKQEPNTATDTSPSAFMSEWLEGMHHRSFFTLAGVGNDFDTKMQLPVPATAASLFATLGGLCAIIYLRRIFAGRQLLLAITVATLLYVAVLWLQLYGSYVATGEPLAINGRYLLPLLIPFGAVIGIGFSYALRASRSLKSYLAATALLLLFWGGGTFTYIVQHDPEWLWPDATVRTINGAAQDAISPLVVK